jgi:hypothetical protein
MRNDTQGRRGTFISRQSERFARVTDRKGFLRGALANGDGRDVARSCRGSRGGCRLAELLLLLTRLLERFRLLRRLLRM